MGAAADVAVYDYQRVDEEHRRAFGRSIDDDWTYIQRALKVFLDGKPWILCYVDDQGWHNSSDEFWCLDEDAHVRVRKTLAAVGFTATAEVWT